MTTDWLGGAGGEDKYRRRVEKVTALDALRLRDLDDVDSDLVATLTEATDT